MSLILSFLGVRVFPNFIWLLSLRYFTLSKITKIPRPFLYRLLLSHSKNFNFFPSADLYPVRGQYFIFFALYLYIHGTCIYMHISVFTCLYVVLGVWWTGNRKLLGFSFRDYRSSCVMFQSFWFVKFEGVKCTLFFCFLRLVLGLSSYFYFLLLKMFFLSCSCGMPHFPLIEC